MKPLAGPLIVGSALVACLAGWVALPGLQSRQTAVDSEASLELERARRLLHQYNAGLDFKSMLLSGLAESGVDVEIKEPELLLDAQGESYEKEFKERWELFSPTEWGDNPIPSRVPGGQLVREVRSGVQMRKEILSRNRELLEEARQTVEDVLSIRSGNSTAADHGAALRLKSVILHQLGLRDLIHAELIRREAMPLLAELVRVSTRASSLAPLQGLVEGSGIAEQIRLLQERLAGDEEKLAADRAALAELESRIEALSREIDAAKRAASDATAGMEGIRARGTNLNDPTNAAGFEALSRAMREALARAQALESGNYSNATIDATGDYLSGTYLPSDGRGAPAIEYGRRHFEAERVVQAARVAGGEQAVRDLRADIARLETEKSQHETRQSDVSETLATLRSSGTTILKDIDEIDAAARKKEEIALQYFDEAAGAGRDAEQGASRWTEDARRKTQGLSPEKRARSGVAHRLQDEWIAGFSLAHAADALAGKGRVYAQRFQFYEDVQRAVGDGAGLLGIPEERIEDVKSQARAARVAGVEAVNQAMHILESVHRSVDNHWTITAQAAGTVYLLALLGQPDYAAKAAESYRAAIKGREDKPFVDRFLSRLKQLEAKNR